MKKSILILAVSILSFAQSVFAESSQVKPYSVVIVSKDLQVVAATAKLSCGHRGFFGFDYYDKNVNAVVKSTSPTEYTVSFPETKVSAGRHSLTRCIYRVYLATNENGVVDTLVAYESEQGAINMALFISDRLTGVLQTRLHYSELIRDNSKDGGGYLKLQQKE